MKNLQEVIKNREPIKISIKDLDTGIYYWDEEKQRYQSDFGFIPIEVVVKVVLGKKEVDHIKIEAVS